MITFSFTLQAKVSSKYHLPMLAQAMCMCPEADFVSVDRDENAEHMSARLAGGGEAVCTHIPTVCVHIPDEIVFWD